MRTRRDALLLGVGIAVVGLLLLLSGPSQDFVTIQGDSGLSMDGAVALTSSTAWRPSLLLGYGLFWLGSVIAAGAVGHGLAARRSA